MYSWWMAESRSPGQRAGLTRDDVLAAAHEILAARGFDGLTMRALAQQLGVAPNAVYSHVANKTALIDELLDDLLGHVEAPDAASVPPLDALHALMVSTFDVLLAHPALVALYLGRQGARGPNAQGLGEVMLTQLGRAGVQGEHARRARRVLIVHTIGFAAFAVQPTLEPDAPVPLTRREITDSFATGLRWLLTGIAKV